MPSCSKEACGVGDSHQGRGVAALNLLSDLKDQCGWTVVQPNQRKDLPSTGPQVNLSLLVPAFSSIGSTHLESPSMSCTLPQGFLCYP